MRFEVFWRVAVVQLVAVALLSILLALIFSHGFFVSWGWLVGPLLWLGCAWLTARIVGLDPQATLIRAVIAGLVSLLAVAVRAALAGGDHRHRPLRLPLRDRCRVKRPLEQ